MIDKRAFLIGFMMGKLAESNVDEDTWSTALIIWSRRFNMTQPEPSEMREVGEFMRFASSIFDRRSTREY